MSDVRKSLVSFSVASLVTSDSSPPVRSADVSAPQAAALIANNLVAPFDEIRIGPKGLRIVRSLDDRPVRAKYNMPAFTWRFEPSRFEPIAREEVALSQALVDKLS